MRDEIPVITETRTVSDAEKTWATLAHLSALAGLVFPVLTSLLPLIIWRLKRNELPLVDEQGKEALNFQLTMLIGFMVSYLLMFVVVGFLLLIIVGIVDLVMIINAAIHVNKGEHYRYPFNFRIIK